MNFAKLAGVCHHAYDVLARTLRPYAFTYPVIEAALGTAFIIFAAILHHRDPNRI